MNRYISKVISITLTLAFLLPLGGNVATASDTEPIYQSDLFFGYHPSYLIDQKGVASYYTSTSDVMTGIVNDYLDSDQAKWTVVKEAIGALDLANLVKLISDTWGGTSFAYENALDAANVSFAQNLLNADSAGCSQLGSSAKVMKRGKQILGLIDTFDKKVFPTETTESYIISEYTLALTENEIFESLSVTMIDVVYQRVLTDLEPLKKALGMGTTALKVAEAVSLALLIEDVRMEQLDTILKNIDSGADLYKGMTRLKSQLRNGWASYFAENYLTEAVIKKLGSALEKGLLGSLEGPFGFVKTILELASWVVFDLIMDIPDLDDISAQQVLTSYCTTLYGALLGKLQEMGGPITSSDITEYQSIFDAYISATNAALDASEKLTVTSNKDKLQNIQNKYKEYGYDAYIASVKETIAALPREQRVLRTVETWTMPLPFFFSAPSDTIFDNRLYCFDGALHGNLVVSGSGPVVLEAVDALRINGDLTLRSSGNLSVPVEVAGDVVSSGTEISMDSLILSGSVPQDVSGEFTAGTVCFSNTGPGVKVWDTITVSELLDNPAGKIAAVKPVKLADGARLSGNFNGSISMLNGTLPDGAVIGGNLTLRNGGTISGTSTAVDGKMILEGAGTVDGCTMTVGGLTSSKSLTLQNDAQITVAGSATLGGTLENPSELAVAEDLTINGLTASGALRAGGDVLVFGTTTLGGLTLDGFFLQEVGGSSFTVGDLNIHNTSGRPLKLGQTITVTGRYDNPSTEIKGGLIQGGAGVSQEIDTDRVLRGGLTQNVPLVLNNCTLTVEGPVSVPGVTLTNARLIVKGKLTLTGSASSIDSDSTLTVRGEMRSASGEIILGGTLDVRDDLTLEKTKVTGGNLALGGDLYGSAAVQTESLILNGLIRQRIEADNLHTGDVLFANTSKGGVLLEKKLYYSGAFTPGATPLFNENNLVREAS